MKKENTHTHTHTMEYYPAIKKNEMDLEGIIPSEVRETNTV